MSALRAFIDYLRSRPEITTPTEMSMGTHHQIGNREHTVHPDLRENHERARETRESTMEELGKMDQKSAPKADTGPHMITVGDLSANMIGKAIVRVTQEGGTVEGILLDIEIDTDHSNIPRGDQAYRAVVTRLRVGLRIGSFTIDGLPTEHPVEVLTEEKSHDA